MQRLSRAWLAGLVATAALGGSAAADPIRVGGLEIAAPWARATPKGAPVGGGYVTITNTGPAADRLLGGSLAAAGRVEIHDMTSTGGIMQMRQHEGGLDIAPGATLTLSPSGTHLMLMDLKAPLVKGQPVSGTLVFEKAGAVPVTFAVEAIGATKPGGP